MGYQEILIKSSELSIEYMSGIIQRKMDPMFIDQADKIATLKNDLISNRAIIYGQKVDIDPLDFKAGDRFLVVCGERDALRNIKKMFPITLRKSIEIYPMESVMQSPLYLGKDYEEIFEDSKIEKQERGFSIRKKLAENRQKIDSKQSDRAALAQTEDQTKERNLYEDR